VLVQLPKEKNKKCLLEDFEQLPGENGVVDVVDEVGHQSVDQAELLLADVFNPLVQFLIVFFVVEPDQSIVKLVDLSVHICNLYKINGRNPEKQDF